MTAGPPRVTIVTQTRVRPGHEAGFAAWQGRIGGAIGQAPGFIEQSVMPPSPPVQVDWVILQRFESSATALAWLHSPQRLPLLQDAQEMLLGYDDIHLLADGDAGVMPSPVSAIIATGVRPGEGAYRRWEHRIAAAQARAPGFQGYRFQPPIPGVQADWLALCVGNVVSVTILNCLVPWISRRLGWWLGAPNRAADPLNLAGVAAVSAICARCMAVFATLF